MNKNRRRTTWFLIFTFLSTISLAVFAQAPDANEKTVREYDLHRQAYKTGLEKEQLRLLGEEKKSINAQSALQKKIAALESEKRSIRAAIQDRNSFQLVLKSFRNGILFTLYPMTAGVISSMSMFGYSSSGSQTLDHLLPIAFGVWAILLFVMLRKYPRDQKPLRHIRLLGIVLLISLLLMSPMLFAQTETTKENRLKDSLELTNNIFSMSDHERYLEILKSSDMKGVLLPDLKSGSKYLKVYRKVDTGSGKAYFTIAALASYLGRNGEAIDALKHFGQNGVKFDPAERDYLITQSLKFMIHHNQPEAAGELLEATLPSLKDAKQLISLSEFLTEKKFYSSAEKTLKRAIQNARSSTDLINLGNYLYSQNKQIEGKAAYNKALKQSRTHDDVIYVASALSSKGILVPSSFIVTVQKKYHPNKNSISKTLVESQINLIDAVYSNKQNENAISLFSTLLEGQKKVKVATYKLLLEYSLSRHWYEQATSVVKDLARKLPTHDRFEVRLRPSVKLKTEGDLPDKNKLSLPVLYGLLNEEQGFNDKAISSYVNSIQHSLKAVQANMGYEVEHSLNDFYLLGRQYKRSGKIKMLSALDRTYTSLEERSLDQLKLENNVKIKELSQDEAARIDRVAEINKEIELLKVQHKDKLNETRLQTVAIFGQLLFLFSLFFGSLIWAREYALKQADYRFSAFVSKFLETIGWVRVCSVFGAFSGMFFVFIGQSLQIFQRKHEELKSISLTGKLQAREMVAERRAVEKQASNISGDV